LINDGRLAVPALPLDYNSPNMRKVIVLLSDGDNNWPNARNITEAVRGRIFTYGTNGRVVLPESTRTELFYTGYGFLSTETRMGITVPNNGQPRGLNSDKLVADYTSVRNSSDGTDANLDTVTRTLCTNIKKNDRITIYVIGFGVATESHRTLLKSCATSTDHYLEAATPEQLAAKFSAIAQQLASLRLSQ